MDKSKFGQSQVMIWFLDRDLVKSAQYHNDAALAKSIDGCFSALTDTVFYFVGIRNKKAYQFCFSEEKKDETMSRFFPCWPLRKAPSMKYYTNRTAKWTRACGEHFEYVKRYMEALLAEWEFRSGRPHKLACFLDWLGTDCQIAVPYGGLSSIALPWKTLKKRFRRVDPVEGYRLQYIDCFCGEDPLASYADVNRDAPEFIIEHFHLNSMQCVS